MFGWLIRIAEGQLYVDSPFDSSVDFVVWVLVFLGSGFEGGWFPQSPLARMLTGLMPLAAIFLIIYLIQVTRQTTPLEQISRRIARGEIITRRSVILDYRAWMRIFVEQIWTDKDSSMFQTVLYTDQFPPPEWNEERDYDAIYARSVSLDDEENLRIVVDEYRLERCDVKGGGKTYHWGVVGQGKCPGKCSAKMSLRYAAMVSDVDGLGTIRCFHPGGPPASR